MECASLCKNMASFLPSENRDSFVIMDLQDIPDGHRVHRLLLVRNHTHVMCDHKDEFAAFLQAQGWRDLLIAFEKRLEHVVQ